MEGERGRSALNIECVYMPTTSTSVAVGTCFERFKEDVFSFRGKGKVVLLGDFNARVGKAADDDDVIGKFGKTRVMLVISLLHEVKLVVMADS